MPQTLDPEEAAEERHTELTEAPAEAEENAYEDDERWLTVMEF